MGMAIDGLRVGSWG